MPNFYFVAPKSFKVRIRRVVRVARNTSTSHNEAIKKEKECKYPADQKEQKRSELMWRQIE